MAYYIAAFGGVTLPLINPITDMPTAPGLEGSYQTLGGGFDAFGSDTAPATFPYTFQYRVMASSQTAAIYITTINGIRALGRIRGTLTRKDQAGTTHTCYARCLDITAADSVETFNAIEITLTFEIWSHWTKNATTTTATIVSSPQTIVVANGGNLKVTDAIITVTAGAASTFSNVTVACGSATWTFGASIGSNTSLVVDCGAWSVLNNGVDAYGSFTFNAGHAIAGMLELAPGNNNVVFTTTGGSGVVRSVSIAFGEAWA
jgi:hypothetical protein